MRFVASSIMSLTMLATAVLCFVSVSIIAGGILANQSQPGGAVAVSAAWRSVEHSRGHVYVVDIVISNTGADGVEVSSVSVHVGNSKHDLSNTTRVLRPGETWMLTASFSVQPQQQYGNPIVEVSYCAKHACGYSRAMAKAI